MCCVSFVVSRWVTVLIVAGAATLTACDFDVLNPGPVQDEFLDDPDLHSRMVAGAGRAFAAGFNWPAFTSAAVARELFPSGSPGLGGFTFLQQNGVLQPDDVFRQWNFAHEARWTAEHFLERMEGSIEGGLADYAPAAELALWAGYSNRLLGELMCNAVIDGGPLEPSSVHLTRAEGQFTMALNIATATSQTDFARAAQAARASVRAYLGDWSGAVADASAIPAGFSFSVAYERTGGPTNKFSNAVNNSPFRSATVWNTFYMDYYTQTGDPRIRWSEDPDNPFGDSAREGYGDVPWKFYLKYCRVTSCSESPIRLSTFNEMQLLLAEDQLINGSWQTGLDIINALRITYVSDTTLLPLVPWSATNLEEAWNALRRERGLELWLEGRRLGDFRRWGADNRPGSLHPLELIEGGTLERALCFPPSENEVAANPNLS